MTEMLQLLPAAKVEPQVLVSPKLVLATMLEMVRVAVPVFVKVTVCALLVVPTLTLLNVKLVGERRIIGEEFMPTPVRDTVWGLLAALSVMVRVPVKVPVVPGLNVTEIVQLRPAPRLEPQVLVSP